MGSTRTALSMGTSVASVPAAVILGDQPPARGLDPQHVEVGTRHRGATPGTGPAMSTRARARRSSGSLARRRRCGRGPGRAVDRAVPPTRTRRVWCWPTPRARWPVRPPRSGPARGASCGSRRSGRPGRWPQRPGEAVRLLTQVHDVRVDRATRDRHRAPIAIDLDVADALHTGDAMASQHGVNTRDQFTRRERLGQVIVDDENAKGHASVVSRES